MIDIEKIDHEDLTDQIRGINKLSIDEKDIDIPDDVISISSSAFKDKGNI